MKLEFCRQILEEYSYVKSHDNSSSKSRVCSMRTDGRTDMMNLKVTFRNFAEVPLCGI
jgi:hypothetical protein